MKRGFVKYHPFDGKLDRMKKANEEKVLTSYFLTEEQVQTIRRELSENDKYSIQDQILFEVSFDSANRIGALLRLQLSKVMEKINAIKRKSEDISERFTK